MIEDKDLTIEKGIAAGDQQVIERFYAKNLRYVRRYVLQRSGNESDVEDVMQDAIVVLYQKLQEGSLNCSCTIHTYFCAIAKNTWQNRLRRMHKVVPQEDFSETRLVLDPTVLEDIARAEQEHLYRKHFANLSSKCKEVLQLVFEGYSMREISHKTAYSEAYARKKKFECKKALLEMIEKDPLYAELQETYNP